jgi:hypothetical protein
MSSDDLFDLALLDRGAIVIAAFLVACVAIG